MINMQITVSVSNIVSFENIIRDCKEMDYIVSGDLAKDKKSARRSLEN